MSRESSSWLNTNTLIGFTDKRGTAWHYRAAEQGEEPNHYPGAVPVEDVARRLFTWSAESRRIAVEVPIHQDELSNLNTDGEQARWVVVEDRQAICRSDTHAVLGVFGSGYRPHQYREWLLSTVADLLDDDLAISSAGLLRGGAVAWVEVSVPDTIVTPQGVAFRPNLLATTSFDGSTATVFKRTITDVVCDNTRALALAEASPEVRVKHSRNSILRLGPARDALGLVHELDAAFSAEVALLCDTVVTPGQWDAFLDAVAPLRDDLPEGRARTMAARKRATLRRLYESDPRVSPWAGTAHGVLQAVNTYEHHEAIVRGTGRGERNMLRTIAGDYTSLDRATWRTLSAALS